MATILNAIYGAFLRRFFAQVQVAEGREPEPAPPRTRIRSIQARPVKGKTPLLAFLH
jgi:hypothetical protein